MSHFNTIPQALDALKRGEIMIVVDDENRENEGDLVASAEHLTQEQMTFIIRHTSGIVFLALTNEIANQLDLPPMVMKNTSKRGTPFTVSIEAAQNVDTGVSAKDRTETVRAAISPTAEPLDLSRPGHIFPLRAEDGGVLVRAGHTEASVDLMKLAGLRHGAVGAELMNDDGTMMRLPALQKFARDHSILIISIADLIAYRRRHESCITLETESSLETETGHWQLKIYRDTVHQSEHVALIKGTINPDSATLVRVHSECITGDVFDSLHCDCGGQLKAAMRQIEEEGSGVVLYLRQEGRGIGLLNKIRAYKLQQEEGLDTVEANEKLGLPADLREYGIGAQILRDVGVRKLRLLTNNPKKIAGLQGFDLEVTEQLPLRIEPTSDRQKKYLQTKKIKMGHIL